MQAVFSQHATLPLQGSKNGHKEEKDGAQAEPWTIKIDRGNEVEGHVPNSIKTAKYNAVTFFPIFLVEMFSRVAYLYFLAQVSSLTENAHSMMSMSCPVTQEVACGEGSGMHAFKPVMLCNTYYSFIATVAPFIT